MTAAASPAPTAEAIQAQIQGEISGQVAIGSHILQIGSISGGLVTLLPPEQRLVPRARPLPLSLRPHRFPGLLNRASEIATATTAFDDAVSVEFHGEPGIGKTCLLRAIAYHPATAAFHDGVVWLSVRDQPVADLLQSLYDVFYERDSAFKPTDGQLRHALSDKQALVLLDDVELGRDDVDAVMDAAPGCTFLLSGTERRLWGQGRSVALPGLPKADGLALIERELGRRLTEDERPAAAQLCAALTGHPLRLLQAAALAREEGLPLAEVVRRIQAAAPADALASAIVGPLAEAERRVLAALAALDTAPIHAEHLAAITQISDAEAVLDALARRNLVLAASPSFSAAGTIGGVARTWDLAAWRVRALTYFTDWAGQHAKMPDGVLEAADAILYLLRWAVDAGRWRDVLHLGRAVEGALALGRRWGAWEQVLGWIGQAARALERPALLALALHQLGTRALCLGDTASARAALTEALQIREALGDQLGAAVTQHNLNVLLGPTAMPERVAGPRAPAAAPALGMRIVLAAVAVLATMLLIGLGAWYVLSAVAAPSGLSAAVTSSNQIALRWTDNSAKEDGFTVERRAGDAPFADLARMGPDVTSYTDADIEPSVTYTYRVRAFHGWAPGLGPRESDPSNEASATVGPVSMLTAVTVDPARVSGGNAATGTVSITPPAPAGGVTIRLSSSDYAIASVPGEVTVEAGQTRAEFPVATSEVRDAVEVAIVAALGDAQVSATLVVEAPPAVPVLEDLVLEPAQVTGGEAVTGTLTLSGPAPAGGLSVALASDNADVARTTLEEVTVPAGQTAASFTVETNPVRAATEVVITAALHEEQRTFTLTVIPPALAALTCQPASVTGGEAATCTVTLSGAAPRDGITVSVGSASGVATTDVAQVRIPANKRSAAFGVQTAPVDAPAEAVITAAFGGVEQTFPLTVVPPPPPPLPDLVVSRLEVLGEPWVAPDGAVELMIRVTVNNAGAAEAGIFKIATEYSNDAGRPLVAAFTVPGQENPWYPFTDASLAPDGAVAFKGAVTFYASSQGQTVSLWAVADSCSGEEFMPDSCRVEEGNEDNNQTTPIAVKLPEAADLIPVPNAYGDYCQLTDQGQLRVIVRSQGKGPAGGSTTAIDFGDAGTVRVPTPALAPGASATLVVDIPDGCFPDCYFMITVDAGNNVGETDNDNNVASGSCIVVP